MQKHRLGDFGGGARFLQKGNCSRQNEIYHLAVSSETTRPSVFYMKTSAVPILLGHSDNARGTQEYGPTRSGRTIYLKVSHSWQP
jgi:hypothetical protein